MRCITLLLVLLVSSACGSTAPETTYYRVHNLTEPQPPQGDLVIGVEPFAADSAYDNQQIVYRKSPYKLNYYHYHSWASPPGIMVADYVREELENSGRFEAVLTGFTADVVAVVGGRIVHFEEVDVSEDEWLARVKLTLFLRDAQTGQLVWSRTITEEEPVDEQKPEGVARAMSIALQRAITSNIDTIAERARTVRSRQTGNPGESTLE